MALLKALRRHSHDEPKKPSPPRVKLREQRWWVRLFFAIGVFSTIGVIVTLFFAFGRRPSNIWVTEAPPVGSEDFLTALAGDVGGNIRTGGEIQFLPNGDRFFPPILADMRAAQKTIHFTTFIWEKGWMADELAKVMMERARAGVKVRVLLDSLGAIRADDAQLDAMRLAGVNVQMFRTARLGRFTRYHRRTHCRSIVIDGKVAYTGGAAIADKWMGDARNEKEWRDDMFRVTGPMAASLQSTFAELWAGSQGEIMAGDGVYPKIEEAPSGIRHISLTSTPSHESHPLRLFVSLTFAGARERLYIASSYFVPDRHTREFVADRARKGLDVRLLVPSDKTDAGPIRQATHHYLEELLAAGVRVWEFQPAMMHCKYIVADGRWSVIGSANMDIRSKELNVENVLGILDEKLAGELEGAFLADLKRSKEIRLEEWEKRGAWKRVREDVAALFVEQY